MKINIFSIPIFLGNIDVKKIKIENQTYKKNWTSETLSSYKSPNISLDEKSTLYLLKIISKLIVPEVKNKFNINLLDIWTNKYSKNDYQEEHIHCGSDFSFIIYSKIKESKTVFVSDYKYLIETFNLLSLFPTEFNLSCRSNQIVVFPSFLKHRVDKNNFSGETISGNVKITLKNE
tara:strand:+ start:2427 stop:2954 length:528 start_codon:yes stop_codon:yes gene_type:complete